MSIVTRTKRTPAQVSIDLEKLEGIVSEFTKSATEVIASNQTKVDQMYDFLFVGRPHESPPVPSFVAIVQRNAEDINAFKNSMSKLTWILVGLIITGASGIAVAMYNNFISAAQAAQAAASSF